METFKIEVQEVLSRIVEVEAKSVEDAVDQVYEQYKKAEIVLDYTDLVEMDVFSQDSKEEKNNLIKEIVDYLFEEEQKHFEEFDVKPDTHIFLKLKRLKELTDF